VESVIFFTLPPSSTAIIICPKENISKKAAGPKKITPIETAAKPKKQGLE
jgi:hypothetical protein